MAIVRREVSDRTFMGKLFKWLFIIFNLLMLVWLVGACMSMADMPAASSDAESTGRGIGMVLGFGFLFLLWMIGDVILGLFVLFTRRRKIVESEE